MEEGGWIKVSNLRLRLSGHWNHTVGHIEALWNGAVLPIGTEPESNVLTCITVASSLI